MASGHGFQWWNLIHSEFLDHNPHVAAATVGLGVFVAGSLLYRRSLSKVNFNSIEDKDLVPPSKFSVPGIFDMVGSFVKTTAKDIIGHGYEKHLPLVIFIFMWILLNNLLGSVAGLGSATDNINTTLSMGVCVFLYYNIRGFMSQGWMYMDQFCGHLLTSLEGKILLILGPILIPMMFIIELISHSVRPLTLGIRLRTNIYADHAVYGTIFSSVQSLANTLAESLGIVGEVIGKSLLAFLPAPIVVLGLLVAVIQAFVFTLLTCIYIGLATSHEDH